MRSRPDLAGADSSPPVPGRDACTRASPSSEATRANQFSSCTDLRVRRPALASLDAANAFHAACRCQSCARH